MNGHLINHIVYADDLVLISPSSVFVSAFVASYANKIRYSMSGI